MESRRSGTANPFSRAGKEWPTSSLLPILDWKTVVCRDLKWLLSKNFSPLSSTKILRYFFTFILYDNTVSKYLFTFINYNSTMLRYCFTFILYISTISKYLFTFYPSEQHAVKILFCLYSLQQHNFKVPIYQFL